MSARTWGAYVCGCGDGPHVEFREDVDGGFVRAEDHARLSAQVEALRGALRMFLGLAEMHADMEMRGGQCYAAFYEKAVTQARAALAAGGE